MWPLAHAKFACDWRPIAYKLYPSGRQSHINRARVVASRMQIVPVWLPVPCNVNKIGRNLHATGDPVGTICMRLAVAGVQDKIQADKKCVKGRLYIIVIFFWHWQVHILDHASDYSADGPWIFSLENALVQWITMPHGSKFCKR
jgi:hypothetical protein